MRHYIALFETLNGKEGYGVVFPDFPGCISAGGTWEEALRMAQEALAGRAALIEKDGETIPEPRTLNEIKETWEDWQEWEKNYRFVIGSVPLFPFKPLVKRVNITMDEILLAKIDQITDNRSAFLTAAAEHLLAESGV